MVACYSYQVGCSQYGGMSPCDKCKDDFCGICQSSCSFVVNISNYNDVKLARLAKEREIPVPADVNNARTYLNLATSLKEDTIEAATTSYKQIKRGETQTQHGHRPCHLLSRFSRSLKLHST